MAICSYIQQKIVSRICLPLVFWKIVFLFRLIEANKGNQSTSYLDDLLTVYRVNGLGNLIWLTRKSEMVHIASTQIGLKTTKVRC